MNRTFAPRQAPSDVADDAQAVVGAMGVVGPWQIEAVDHDIGSPTTAGLFRARGDGWSMFLKVIQSYRRWPLFHLLPADWLGALPVDEAWRWEADIYVTGLDAALPAGMRLAEVVGLTPVGDDRMVLALEDVRTSRRPWDEERFGRAARLLGRLNARLTAVDVLPPSVLRLPGQRTDLFFSGRIAPVVLPVLADDATWRHPLLAAETMLRADIARLAERLPAILGHLATLPQLFGHGDASPQNLLVPADDPETFVVIDWATPGLTAVGDDLGQLLVGLAHAGALDAEAIAGLHELLVREYTAGLAAEGVVVSERLVREGMDGGLAVRSALAALPLERLGEPVTPQLVELFRTRVALTRYLVDVGLGVPFDTIGEEVA